MDLNAPGDTKPQQECHNDSATDYTKTDCDSAAPRRFLMQQCNAMHAAGYSTVVDVPEQKLVKAKPTLFECYGPYVFSEGSTKKMLYRETTNSFGERSQALSQTSW